MSKIRKEMLERLREQMAETAANHELTVADHPAIEVSSLDKDDPLMEHVNDIQQLVADHLDPQFTGVQFSLSFKEQYVVGVLFGQVVLIQACDEV